MNTRLRIAIQKKGRLAQESTALLEKCGLKFKFKDHALLSHVENLPIDLLLIRDDDIPALVFDKLCDGGIVGENVLLESALNTQKSEYQILLPLANCCCRLVIATPQDFNYQGPASLEGKRIATSYPNLLKRFLNEKKIVAESLVLSGSIEVAPRMGMADVICDLVSTGQTLEENKLIEVETLLESQAVFILSTANLSPEKQQLINLMQRRIKAVQQAKESKYILFHAPKTALNAICQQLPGFESPTILELPNQPDKVAVHVVAQEKIFWETLDIIQNLGATSLVVLPIEKMMG